MNTSEHPRDRLSAYADDELPADERAAVDGHLRECAACRQELEDLGAVDEAARALPVPEPEGYFEAFPGRVRERLAARRRRTLPTWTWAAAAAVLLAALTPLTLMSRKEASPQPPGANAPAAVPAAPPATAEAPEAESARRLNGLGYVASPAGPRPRNEPPPRFQSAGTQKSETRERLARRDAGAGEAPPTRQPPRRPLADELLHQARASRPAEERDAIASGAAGAAPPAPTAAAPRMATRPKAAAGKDGRQAVAVDEGRAASPSAAAIADSLETRAAASRAGMVSDDSLAGLAARPQTTADEARAAAAAYRAYAQRHAGTDAADEARVRAVEALAAAWRMERRPADRDTARREARLYLAAPGPRSERVRALLAGLEP